MLVSLSMGQNFDDCKNQGDLVKKLQDRNVITSQETFRIMHKLDRQFFSNDISLYQNSPSLIKNQQKMTSPLMHAIAFENLFQKLSIIIKNKSSNKRSQSINILDIGTGHGYLAFGLQMYLEQILFKQDKSGSNFDKIEQEDKNKLINIEAIDIFQEIIEECKKINESLFKRSIISNKIKINFQKYDLFQYLSEKLKVQENVEQQGKFDLINSGIALSFENKEHLLDLMADENSFMLCPLVQDDQEQGLFLIEKQNEEIIEKEIMKCMFSTLLDEQKVQIQNINLKQLEEKFIDWKKQFTAKNQRNPTLKEIQSHEEISEVLKQIQKQKRSKTSV